MAIPKKSRVALKKDFKAIFQKGRAANGNFLFIKYITSENLIDPQLNIIVSGKASKKASLRNKIKRIVAAVAEPRLKHFIKGLKALVVVMKLPSNDYRGQLSRDFIYTSKKARIYEEVNN